MKLGNYFVLRSIAALLLGLLLVVWPDTAMRYLVITIGAVFLVPGLFMVIGYFTQKPAENGSRGFFPIGGVGSVLFGFWMMVMPDFFVNFLMYILGFILLMGGVQQLALLIAARKYVPIPFIFYLMPVVLLSAGGLVLFNPFEVASTALIVLGSCSLLYGLTELFNGFRFYRKKKKAEEEQMAEVIEVKAEKEPVEPEKSEE